MSPKNLMPPSAITGTPDFARPARAASMTAVNCGTPTPATMRVVQIDPGPIPTLTGVSARAHQAPSLHRRWRHCRQSPALRWRRVSPAQTCSMTFDGMTVRRINDNHDIAACVNQRFDALEPSHHRQRLKTLRRRAAAPQLSFAGKRVFLGLFHVLDGDEAGRSGNRHRQQSRVRSAA